MQNYRLIKCFFGQIWPEIAPRMGKTAYFQKMKFGTKVYYLATIVNFVKFNKLDVRRYYDHQYAKLSVNKKFLGQILGQKSLFRKYNEIREKFCNIFLLQV